MKIRNPLSIFFIGGLITICILSYFFFFRIDLTSDKRYSISQQSKELMHGIHAPLNIVIYLDGDLNPGFLRLKKSTDDIIQELAVYSKGAVNIQFINPSEANTSAEREANYNRLYNKGLAPTSIYERDKEGKSIQKTVFPWMEISYNGRNTAVCLLKNNRLKSGDENLNVSIENLEFEITDGIRQLTNTEVAKIAFIEGHGELSEAETYDISKSLSRYFQIDRGVLATDAGILNKYKAIIVAKPTQPFSETDKYIIDQYIMRGGRVLWLLDGVRIAKENLSKSGLSPAMELDVNLSDQLFRYGVRINPVLLQDVQCTSVPVNIAPINAAPQFEPSPWFYSPLLLTSPEHPATRNIPEVKADFCSGIDLVGENKKVNAQVILATSNNTHVIGIPSTIDLSQTPKPTDKAYFNAGFLPVAVALEGNFESNFMNRMQPKGLTNTQATIRFSPITRQIIVADGDIIRNETNGIASDSTTVPLGFDRYMNQQFGNKEFILNSVLFLTDNDGWMQLRNRTVKLRLLNKSISSDEKTIWQSINTLIPILLLISFALGYTFFRKRKYTRIKKANI